MRLVVVGIMGSGMKILISKMGRESLSPLVEVYTRDISKITRSMEEEDISKKVVILMRENGKMVTIMDLAKKPILMELTMKGNGMPIENMVRECTKKQNTE